MKRFIFWLSIFLVTACNNRKPAEPEPSFTLNGDTVMVSSASVLNDKLKLASVHPGTYRNQLQAVGTVQAIPTQFAEIAPPFAGRILHSFVKLGMRVKAGEPLFEISSPDFMSAQKQYFQAKSQFDLSMQTLKRQQDLMKNGVTSRKDLEEAETGFAIAKKEYETALVSIRLFRSDPEKLVLGQPLVVRSPISGEVIDNRIIVGQYLREDASSVATVAALQQIWVVAQIKEKDLRFIRQPDECSIEPAAMPGTFIKGRLFHVNEVLDENTRSVQVLIECNNSNRLLKPGMFVNVRLQQPEEQALLIPATAVLQQAGESFVFLAVGTGKYIRQKVETAATDNDMIVIQSGLHPGDNILVQGGFYLTGEK